MTSRNLLVAALALAACSSHKGPGISINKDLGNGSDGSSNANQDGSSNPPNDGGVVVNPNPDLATQPLSGTNQVAVTVDDGPSGLQSGSANVGFVSVQICAPGSTTNCATIDHISVDTGSVGLRILNTAIPSGLLSGLPISQTSGGKSITECYGYADGFVYGTVRTADFTLGGESVASMPFHVIGDKSVGGVPSSCAQFGQEEDDLQTFGSNGIIGLAPFGPDCTSCTGTNQGNPLYYGCSGSTCSLSGVPQASQLSNPVSLFAQDNNGIILSFPDPGDAVQASLTGTLTFGIGTQSNNALGSGLKTFPIGGDLEIPGSSVAGKSCSQGSFFDSGTNFVGFDDSSLTGCTGNYQGFYCPASVTPVSCSNTDGNGTKQTFTFDVGNATTLFNGSSNSDAVFKAIVAEGGGTCDWGLPFFYGKKMYIGIEGATVSGATTPFEAY